MSALMVAVVVVTVLIGGILVPSSRPASIRDGSVIVPLVPFVRDLAETLVLDPAAATIEIRRGGRSATIRAGTEDSGGMIYVPLAVVVRALGGTVRFDAVRKVAAVEMPPAGPLATPTPFDPSNPTVAPKKVFTPQPVATPRSSPSGHPQPRRTPVPVVPSYPSLASP